MAIKQPDIERLAAVGCAALSFLLIFYLALRNEAFSDPNIVVLIRIILSVSVAITANHLLGSLQISGKIGPISLKATGAFAFGVITFIYTPKVITLELEESIAIENLNSEARRLITDGHCDRAILIVNDALRMDELNWKSLNTLGAANFACDNYDIAVEAWESARKYVRSPNDIMGVRFNLSAGYIALGRHGSAKAELSDLWSEASSSGNPNPEVAFNYGLSLAILGNFSEALAVLCAPKSYRHLDEMARIIAGFAKSRVSSNLPKDSEECSLLERENGEFESDYFQAITSNSDPVPLRLKALTPLINHLRTQNGVDKL